VKLPKLLTELAPLLQPLERFFSAPQELKQRCHIPPQFGYSAVRPKSPTNTLEFSNHSFDARNFTF
jgi:hypothetical protein